MALGIEVEDRPFAKSTLQLFRARLILHQKVREMFERSLRFARETGYRQLPDGLCLDAVLCFKYLRSVVNDNTVRFNGAAIQILSDGYRTSYARAQVEVQERLDGSIVVAYQGNALAAEPAPDGPVELRARSGPRSNGHLPAERPAPYSNGALTHPVGAERPNGAKRLQGADPLPPPTRRSGHPRRPAPDHPWRRTLLT